MTSEIQPIELDGRTIGPGHPPYIIGELSANHGGDFDRAERIINEAAAAGADAIKFQLYSPDSITLNSDRPDFMVQSQGLWKGRRLYELYAEAATPIEWFPRLFDATRKAGATPFASVFAPGDIEILENLDAPAYKVASFEAIDHALVEACARTGKPVIISTGLCTFEEIQETVEAFRAAGGKGLALLRCNSAYPAAPEEADLATIPHMAQAFDVPVGYSDHTLTSYQAIAAVALGACIVEKHVIDAREPATADSAFSCLPEQFAELVQGCHAAFAASGKVRYGPTPKETGSLQFRRSLYAVKNIQAGEPFSEDNVRSVRPGCGLPPKHLAQVLRSVATRDIDAGEPISFDLLR